MYLLTFSVYLMIYGVYLLTLSVYLTIYDVYLLTFSVYLTIYGVYLLKFSARINNIYTTRFRRVTKTDNIKAFTRFLNDKWHLVKKKKYRRLLACTFPKLEFV
jgi:hypothetical protein